MFYTVTCPWGIFNYKNRSYLVHFYFGDTSTISPLTAWLCTPLGWSVCQTKSSWDSQRHILPEHHQTALSLLHIWTWTVTFGRIFSDNVASMSTGVSPVSKRRRVDRDFSLTLTILVVCVGPYHLVPSALLMKCCWRALYWCAHWIIRCVIV